MEKVSYGHNVWMYSLWSLWRCWQLPQEKKGRNCNIFCIWHLTTCMPPSIVPRILLSTASSNLQSHIQRLRKWEKMRTDEKKPNVKTDMVLSRGGLGVAGQTAWGVDCVASQSWSDKLSVKVRYFPSVLMMTCCQPLCHAWLDPSNGLLMESRRKNPWRRSAGRHCRSRFPSQFPMDTVVNDRIMIASILMTRLSPSSKGTKVCALNKNSWTLNMEESLNEACVQGFEYC